MITDQCTKACEASPECKVCGRRKYPRGRDPGMNNSGCSCDCPGFYEEPLSGHLWPGELKDWLEDQKAKEPE